MGTPHSIASWGNLSLSLSRIGDNISETGTSEITCGVDIPSGSTHTITLVGKLGMMFPTSACLASATKSISGSLRIAGISKDAIQRGVLSRLTLRSLELYHYSISFMAETEVRSEGLKP